MLCASGCLRRRGLARVGARSGAGAGTWAHTSKGWSEEQPGHKGSIGAPAGCRPRAAPPPTVT
eukprot:scaffold1223_cov380-Prasinococcus_capsulatus_cf.AAC.11